MTDFASAFQRGQRAAEDAAQAREEVSSVLLSLKQQVSEATNGVIEITVEHDVLSMATKIARALRYEGNLSSPRGRSLRAIT